MNQTLEYKIKYPYFTGRNYVVAVYDNPTNKPLWDPTNFFFARWLLTKKTDLENILEKWLIEKPKLVEKLKEEEGGTVFNLDKEYLLKLGEQHQRKKLTELIKEELVNVTRQKSRKRFGSYNFVDLDYRDFFFFNDPEHSERLPHSGDIVLTAYVKPKMGGTKERRFHTIKIKGPFEDSKIPFAMLSDDCKDFSFVEVKAGYEPTQKGCTEIAATLLLARYHPELIKNLQAVLKRRNSKIRLPFHVHEPQLSSEKVYYTIKGKQPNFAYLMVDSVFDYVFNNETKFKISKALTKIPVIYDTRYLLDKIQDGNAGFEAIANKYFLERSNPIPIPVRKLFDQLDFLYRQKGFKFNRLVVENKDSPHEAIVMEYVKENEVRRLVFGEYPPLERKIVFDKKTAPDIFLLEKQKELPSYSHPYEKLFNPHFGKQTKLEDFDDASRRMPIFSEYRIPWFTMIPEEMLHDYHVAIEKYFKGGNENLKRWLYVRNNFLESTKYKDEKIKNMSLFLKISKAK